MSYRLPFRLIAASALALATAPAMAADKTDAAAPGPNAIFKEAQVASSGTVTVKGQKIDYQAISGTIVVHPEHWDDAAWRAAGKSANSPPASLRLIWLTVAMPVR